MKSYFRFLFVGAVLLVLLGLFNSQRNDDSVARFEPTVLELALLQNGFLPLDPVQSSPQVFSSQNYPEGSLEFIRLNQETHLSKLAKEKLLEARRIIGEISPDLLHRTGHFIHKNSGSGIPS
jgi:hypothetical protein